MHAECISISLTEVKDIEDLDEVPNYAFKEIQELLKLVTPKSRAYI